MSIRGFFSRHRWDWSNISPNDFDRLTLPQKRGKILELTIYNLFRDHGRKIWKGYLDYYDLDNRVARGKFEGRSGVKVLVHGSNAVGLDGIVELENDYLGIQIKYRKRQRLFDSRTFYQEIERYRETIDKPIHPCVITNSIQMESGDFILINGSHLLFWCRQLGIEWPKILEDYPNNYSDPLELELLRKFLATN